VVGLSYTHIAKIVECGFAVLKRESTGFNADGKIIIVQGRGEMDMAKVSVSFDARAP
jgi:hypothetical protein